MQTNLSILVPFSLALLALAPPTTAAPQAQTGLGGGAFYSTTGPGAGFVQVSNTTRTAGVVFTQPCPFNVILPPVPVGAVEVQSYAVWNWMLGGAAPATDTIAINGAAVMGALAGQGQPDLCWGKTRGVTYLADVTGLLFPGGVNMIGGACDKALGADPNALGEGITLVFVFELPGAPQRQVDLWVGYTSTESSATGTADAVLGLTSPYSGGPAHFFLNALDGQLGGGDNLEVNGFPVSGVLAGTAGAGNAWVGQLGPRPHTNLYDAVEDDLSPLMTPGDASVGLLSTNAGDCIAHTLAVLSRDVGCAPPTVYCTAKVNSLGCTPSISSSGVPSATAGSGFFVRAVNERNNKAGILIYGTTGAAAFPFQAGTLCVNPPIKRTGALNSGGTPPPANDCSGTYEIDMNLFAVASPTALPELTVPGTVVHCQFWGRDGAAPFGTSLSDALKYTVCP